jgi:hypothetical protein
LQLFDCRGTDDDPVVQGICNVDSSIGIDDERLRIFEAGVCSRPILIAFLKVGATQGDNVSIQIDAANRVGFGVSDVNDTVWSNIDSGKFVKQGFVLISIGRADLI